MISFLLNGFLSNEFGFPGLLMSTYLTIQEQVQDADIVLTASQIAYRELERRQTKELDEKRSELQSVKQELESMTDKANKAVELLDTINAFVSSFRLFSPTIE